MILNPTNGHRKSVCGRIESLFRELHLKKKKAFIPYIMAGDPSIEQTMEMVIGLSKLGADLIELGVPFSDPIADGPVIQRASTRSLGRNTTLPEILDMVASLRKRIHHYPGELSGGEQQRVALARALVLNPQIILADEPTGNLDTHTSETIFSLLKQVQREKGITLVIVTHNESLASQADRVIKMVDGKMVNP